MDRMHEFVINSKSWITVDQLAARFLVSRSKAYSVIRELIDARKIEVRNRLSKRGFEYRGKCS